MMRERNGFTLLEVIASVMLIPLLWFAIHISLSVNKMFTSQSKHRAQAVFIAQQYVDMMRAIGIINMAATPSQSVTIDKRGTVGTGDDLVGTANIASAGLYGNGHYLQVQVAITWNERLIGGLNRTFTESLATFICDDSAR
jgi:prepilin-type N-terminal cleavage/methylation domain-containing protein